MTGAARSTATALWRITSTWEIFDEMGDREQAMTHHQAVPAHPASMPMRITTSPCSLSTGESNMKSRSIGKFPFAIRSGSGE